MQNDLDNKTELESMNEPIKEITHIERIVYSTVEEKCNKLA